MLKSKKLIVLVAALMVLAMVFTGCQAGSQYPGTPNDNEATINLGSEPPQMSSLSTTDATSFNVIRHVSEGLVALDENDNPIPGMAESWEISDDQLVYTFTMRDGVTWSDGTPLTAKDFEFTFKELLNPEGTYQYAYMGYVIKNGANYHQGKCSIDEVGVKALDDKTLEITLEAPAPYFLGALAFGCFMPVPEHFYNVDTYGTEADNMLYNGPFIMESWEHENKIVLVKNPNYWDKDNISIEKINMMMIKDSNTALNTFESGEIDMIGLTGDQAMMMKENGMEVSQYSDGSSWALAYNLEDEMISNINLRKALTLAINREDYIKNVLKNNSQAAFNWTTPTLKLGESTVGDQVEPIFEDNDVEGAKAALEEAKKELGVDTITVELLTDDTDQAKLNAAYIQECWKQIGVEATVATVPFNTRLDRQDSGDYQVSFYGWSPDYNDPMTFLEMWETGGGNNICKYSNPEYDKNVQIARTSTNAEERTQALLDMEQALMDDYVLGPIYFRMRDYITSDKLEGVIRTTFQDINLRGATAKAK